MKKVAIPIVLAIAACSLVSCAAASPASDALNIVASTNVYGSIAQAIAGDHAHVTSIIDSHSQDPHSFEASARVQLELSRADVVVDNGGGYDDFVGQLLAGANNTAVTVITAVDVSALSADNIGANEHVWYDLGTVDAVASSLAGALELRDPANARDYRSNLERFTASITGLISQVKAIAARHTGDTVMVTEPVPLYLLESAGLTDITPPALSTAIENGNGVAPAVLDSALKLLRSGSVSLFVFNEQTAGPETAQLRAAATRAGVPEFGVTETLPAGRDYLEWMADNIRSIEEALA